MRHDLFEKTPLLAALGCLPVFGPPGQSVTFGALLAMWLLHYDLSVITLIGLILLVGIVKKNAIMMVDVALGVQREHKLYAEDAIFKASLLRFRPIMMTTMCALLGAIPLVVSSG